MPWIMVDSSVYQNENLWLIIPNLDQTYTIDVIITIEKIEKCEILIPYVLSITY